MSIKTKIKVVTVCLGRANSEIASSVSSQLKPTLIISYTIIPGFAFILTITISRSFGNWSAIQCWVSANPADGAPRGGASCSVFWNVVCYVYISIDWSICLCVSKLIFVEYLLLIHGLCLCLCAYLYVWVCVPLSDCMCVCIYVCMKVCMYAGY